MTRIYADRSLTADVDSTILERLSGAVGCESSETKVLA